MPIKDGFLNKAALVTLYGECGDKLHRGNVRKLLKGDDQIVIDFEKIRRWHDQIVRLLNHHQIQMADPNWQLWVIMQSDTNNKVNCSIWQKVGKAPTNPIANPLERR